MYYFRQLTTPEDVTAFRDEFCAQLSRRSGGGLKIEIPVERLAGCGGITGVYRGGKLVAGYIVNDRRGQLALLRVLPAEVRERWLARVPGERICELNLIWRNSGIGANAFALIVWPRIIIDCLANGSRHILGSGYDNPLNQRYAIAEPEVIYAGPSATSGVHVYVYVYSRSKLVATFFSSFAAKFLSPRRRKAARA